MEEKNRFSRLLEHLMLTAEIKNYTLAQDLQYDVSYISKWVNGRILPAEKVEKKVLAGISRCVVASASPEQQQDLMEDYQVSSSQDLETAIYDNLQAEYNYVKDLQSRLGTNIAPKTFYFAELPLSQYLLKMHHPVLRRVKSLDIMSVMDLMSMDHEYRIQIGQLDSNPCAASRMYPNVHFSMLIDLHSRKLDYIYDTIFLINMLTDLSHVDFRLYSDIQARGKAIFAVKDDFSISGMLISRNKCISVTASEEPDNCNILYHNIEGLCNREPMLFRKTTMQDMLSEHDYARTILSPRLRWLFGHMTEHFLPDSLFETLLDQLPPSTPLDEMRKMHSLTQTIVEKSPIQLVLYESALSDLAVSENLDFFNCKLHMTAAQRLQYMTHLLSLFEKCENLEIRLIHGRIISDSQYISNPCMFLSDVISYLRLDNCAQSSLLLVNQPDMQDIFDHFYEEVWNNCKNVVISDRCSILSYIQHSVQALQLICHAE